LAAWFEHVGMLAVFVLVFTEQVGLPLPVYPVLVAAGAWSARGGAPIAQITAVAVAACLLPDLAWYWSGRHFGSRVLRAMCRLSLEPDSCVSDSEHLFERFGPRILIVTKFIPGLGAVATVMSGVVRARVSAFLLYDSIGAALWALSGLALGSIFHYAVDDVLSELAALGRAGGVLILTLLSVFLAWKFWRRHQFFRQLRMSRITVQELHRLREEGTPLLLVDARPSASRARDGMIPGAVAFELLLEDTEQSRRGGEVVVYCACPNEATAARIARKLMSLGFHPVRPLAGGIHAWQDAGFTLVS